MNKNKQPSLDDIDRKVGGGGNFESSQSHRDVYITKINAYFLFNELCYHSLSEHLSFLIVIEGARPPMRHRHAF